MRVPSSQGRRWHIESLGKCRTPLGVGSIDAHGSTDQAGPAGSRPHAADSESVPGDGSTLWVQFESELNELLALTDEHGPRVIHGRLVKRVASAVAGARTPTRLLPLAIEIDQTSATDSTVFHIRGLDSPGFLYELTNAIAVSGLSISRMTIRSVGSQVVDTLHVVDERCRKLDSSGRLNELRAAIVLTKHFTHLLPQSPNPESALLHFEEFLENLFRQHDWLDQLSPLHDSEVLGALARLLGVSDFLWDDFLRVQHENLFPVVAQRAGSAAAARRGSIEGRTRPRRCPGAITRTGSTD